MRKRLPILLDFEVDKLTNSIENVVTGEVFATSISLFTKDDAKVVLKKNGWKFDWRYELRQKEREVYKLTTVDNLELIHGLISIEDQPDHIKMKLIESAPFNLGKGKLFDGVAGNLVAFVCKESFDRGFEGNLSFLAKTKLIDHYRKTLGAFHVGNHIMVIKTGAALLLIDKYFNNEKKTNRA